MHPLSGPQAVAETSNADLLRLHCNENPYPPPDGVAEAVAAELSARCTSYPDPECTLLRARIAEYAGMQPDQVATGNGTDELVLLSTLAFGRRDKAVLITDSTFPGYRTSARLAAIRPCLLPLDGYRLPVDALESALTNDIALAFVCNPHNPTGSVLTPEEVEQIITRAEMTGTVAVFDEAYMEFAGPAYDHALRAVRAGRRLLVLRTFSKSWGLASLRAGYALGPADLVARLWQAKLALPFSLNRLASVAAAAALDHPEYLDHVRKQTEHARQRLYDGLAELGVTAEPSVTNFVMVRCGDSTRVANELATAHGVLVRDLTAFGLAGHIRVTVGTPSQVDRFCAALDAVLSRSASR